MFSLDMSLDMTITAALKRDSIKLRRTRSEMQCELRNLGGWTELPYMKSRSWPLIKPSGMAMT